MNNTADLARVLNNAKTVDQLENELYDLFAGRVQIDIDSNNGEILIYIRSGLSLANDRNTINR